LTIAALFFLPLVLAWLMYTGTIEFRPHSTRNLGELVQPPVPVSWSNVRLDATAAGSAEEVFSGHWLILHALPHPCPATCLTEVADLRQIHRAAGRQQSRIRLGLLHDLEASDDIGAVQEIYAEFQLIQDPEGSLWKALEQVAGQIDPPAPVQGSTYLIDPLGNIILFYAAEYDPNDLKKDLKRLLTWSKLDDQS
jgi:cytochrome oxidase Cu insertion factor (SCO1/SenC/PrrC family)